MLVRVVISLALTLGATSALAKDRAISDDGRMRHRYRSLALHIDGTAFRTSDGRSVALHGVNIGGWLVLEDWMCGIADAGDTLAANGVDGVAGRAPMETLAARFGPTQASALRTMWEDHWITTADLDLIRQGGFNLIRVPISYRTLQNADGSWVLDARRRIDFGRMDWIVREAAARGVYTIFDLHVWPEQRRAYQKIGKPEGAAIRDAMARLWTQIARHYRGNGAIAAFDLINEFPGAWGVQQVLAKAVSDADPRRIQVVEGFTYAEFLKLHDAGAFPNSMFSDHFYDKDPLATDEIERRLQALSGSKTPVYVGEFFAADFPAATRAMNRAGIGWSSWTYKTIDMGEWGAFNYPSALRTDIEHDPYADIVAKWSNALVAWQTQGVPPPGWINRRRFPQDVRLILRFPS